MKPRVGTPRYLQNYSMTINNKFNLRSDDLCGKSNEEIVQILRKFYCNIRKCNGEPYAKKTMISFRYGLYKKIQKLHKFDYGGK
jgi:hypothetical protein